MSLAFEKASRISLACKLDPVLYQRRDSLVDESFHATSNPHLFGRLRPGGPFSKVAVVTGPEKFLLLLLFSVITFNIERLIVLKFN